MPADHWLNPWLPLARTADVLAHLASAASYIWPQAKLYGYGLKAAAFMLRHPAFMPVSIAQTAHHLPYWR
jgi:hypothetical protein